MRSRSNYFRLNPSAPSELADSAVPGSDHFCAMITTQAAVRWEDVVGHLLQLEAPLAVS